MKRTILALSILLGAASVSTTANAWWWPWNNSGWGPWGGYPYYGGYPHWGGYPYYGGYPYAGYGAYPYPGGYYPGYVAPAPSDNSSSTEQKK